jgi:hypothetical protein
VDSTPPPSASPPLALTEPPAYVYAPSDIYPRTPEEKELCESASHPDWIYLTGILALDVGVIGFAGPSPDLKYSSNEWLRMAPPAMLGFTAGVTLGGGYLSLPKCAPEWVGAAPREGQDRPSWPLALSIALVSAAMGPITWAVATGPQGPGDSTEERALHVVVASVAGFGGALLPYLLPPKTWRAKKELERIRAGADSHGAYFGYAVAF